jgi:hypothetical protein
VRRPHAHVVSGQQFSRGRLAVVSALAAALLTGGGLSLVDGASAKPGNGRSETPAVGRNWHWDRQDAQPNYRARVPAERGQRQTPQERLEQVRPAGKTGAPHRVPSADVHAPVTEENPK